MKRNKKEGRLVHDLSYRLLKISLGNKKVVIMREYKIGDVSQGGVVSPGSMATGKTDEVLRLYKGIPYLVNNYIQGATMVPYSFLSQEGDKNYGNYTSFDGQNEFKDATMVLSDSNFCPPDWVSKLWRFSRLKRKKIFSTDSALACIRALDVRKNKVIFELGKGLYSESFYSNGSEGIRISLTNKEEKDLASILSAAELGELRVLYDELSRKYGVNCTVREAIFSQYNHLPEFGEHVYNNSIGVAGMVITADNEFVFVKRGKNVSVNYGVNCTASGAAEFNKNILSTYGIQDFLGEEMNREVKEELGFNVGDMMIGSMKKRIKMEVGLNESDYTLIPVGFIRELTRGGKPECMFLIRSKLTASEVVEGISSNAHSERKEIDGLVYVVSLEDVGSLLADRRGGDIIQHKGIVNLMLALEYLRNN